MWKMVKSLRLQCCGFFWPSEKKRVRAEGLGE